MQYWPVCLLIVLFSTWLCQFPLSPKNGSPRDFKLVRRYKLLGTWALCVIFGGLVSAFLQTLCCFSFRLYFLFILGGKCKVATLS